MTPCPARDTCKVSAHCPFTNIGSFAKFCPAAKSHPTLSFAMKWTGIFGWMIFICVFAYWQFLDNPALFTKSAVTVVNPSEIYANGSRLILLADVCTSRPMVPDTAERWITNATIYSFADSTIVFPDAGCNKSPPRGHDLPAELVPGPHLYHFCATFQVNPIKRMRGCETPVPFEVLARLEQQGPRGAPGPTGKEGVKGKPGDQGERGNQGPRGSVGP